MLEGTGKFLTSVESSEIQIGADPELFCFDKEAKCFVSAHTIFPGTKNDPFPVGLGAIQVDGTAFEFNINPAKTKDEFVSNISKVLKVSSAILRKHSTKLDFRAVPTVLYNQAYFDALPEETKLLGCEPDYNAYSGLANKKPTTTLPMRTGSGHLHVGWRESGDKFEEAHFHDCRLATMQLDACLYIPSLVWDHDQRRRELYGDLGAFRPKSYGFEYRVLSNAWLSDPCLIGYVFEATKRAMELLSSGVHLYSDKTVKEFMKDVFQGMVVQIEDAVSFADLLEDVWDFPKFPVEMLDD